MSCQDYKCKKIVNTVVQMIIGIAINGINGIIGITVMKMKWDMFMNIQKV